MISQFCLIGNDMVICNGGIAPQERPEFKNGNGVGETIYLYYSYDGNYSKDFLGNIYYDDDIALPIYSDRLYDMSFLYNKSFYGVNQDRPVYWISVNPIPSDTKFNYEKIDGPSVKELPASDKKRRIIVLRGTPIINGVQLEFLKVGSVKEGKSISLNLKDEDKILLLEDI